MRHHDCPRQRHRASVECPHPEYPGVRGMSAKLDPLFAYLDGLRDRPSLDTLSARLTELDLSIADLAGWVRFSPRSYQRNLVRAGEWYHVWVMCWRNGQRSPIHDHAHSACCVKVLSGNA